jgi:hypothetical protein
VKQSAKAVLALVLAALGFAYALHRLGGGM